MTGLKYWMDKLSGNETVALEQRVFNGAVLVSIGSFLFAIGVAVLQGWQWVAPVLIAYIAFFSIIYYLSRIKQQLQLGLLLFFISVSILLNIFWIADPFAQSGLAFYFFVLLMVVAFTADKPQAYIVVVLVNVLILWSYAESLRVLLDWQTPYSEWGQFLTFYTALVYLATLALLYKKLVSDRDNYELLQLLEQLRQESLHTNKAADGLAKAGDVLSASALQQKAAIEQLLVSTEELAATAQQNRQHALESLGTLSAVEQQIVDSQQVADEFVDIAKDINQSSEEVQTINNVINDIAWQTNLLSLNAMIEAARAGEEHGGFRVVALEVKRLAEGAAEAAEQINRVLAHNANLVKHGMETSQQVQLAFEQLNQQVNPLSQGVRSMSDASIEQTHAILQINQGLIDIDRAVHQNQQAAEDTANTASHLRVSAESLLKIVEKV